MTTKALTCDSPTQRRLRRDACHPHPATLNSLLWTILQPLLLTCVVQTPADSVLQGTEPQLLIESAGHTNHGRTAPASTAYQVITDGGKEFQLGFKDLMKQLNIQHNMSAAYNPQSNGQAGAAVKTILHGLHKAVGDNPHSWDDKLPLVLLG